MAKKYMMKHYDYTYLTRQDMSEEDAKKLQEKLTTMITAKQGTVGDLPKAYKKRLAYRIKKQDAAFINTILFEAESAAIEEFKKETDKIVEILRGLVISYDPEKLKREIRPEMPAKEAEIEPISAKNETETLAAGLKEKEAIKPVADKEEIKEENKEEKSPAKTEEKKAKIVPKEAEPASAQGYGEAKEEKTKPKRRTRTKTELKDIEQKLDEILK